MTIERPWYNINDLYSRGCKSNFATGGRGLGKSFSWKQDAFGQWLNRGKESVVLRRYEKESDLNKHGFWKDFLPTVGYETRSKGMNGLIRQSAPDYMDSDEKQVWNSEHPWQQFCYYMSISQNEFYRGLPFDNVSRLLFDEFVRISGRGYHNNEVDLYLEILETVFRTRDGKAVAFSNAGSMTNPYYMHYGITSKDLREATSGYIKRGAVLFHYYNPEEGEVESIARNTGTESYKARAYGNQFTDSGDELVVAKPTKKEPVYKFTYDNRTWLTLYRSSAGRWIDEANPQGVDGYSLVSLDFKTADAPYNASVVKSLKQAFDNRLLTFSTPDVRNLFIDWLTA